MAAAEWAVVAFNALRTAGNSPGWRNEDCHDADNHQCRSYRPSPHAVTSHGSAQRLSGTNGYQSPVEIQ
jgi:hypothetical protein